nr:reverse transcriptase domain-containing protein [Tanacetum cinerariifolium]
MLKRRVSPTPHDAMLDRWRSRVALRSSPPTTSAPEIPTAPIPPAPSAVDIPIGRLYRTYPGGPCRDLTVRKLVKHFTFHHLALRYTSHHLDCFTFRSSSDHSSSGHSILCHFVSGHTPLVTTITDSSAPLRFVYPPLARTPQYKDAYRHWRSSSLSTLYPPRTYVSLVRDSSFESSVEPSRKRCRSHVSTVTSFIHTSRALVPSRAHFLPPRKRFKDSILPEDTIGEEIDTDVLADIKADAMVVDVVADIGVEAMVNVGIGMEVDVGVDVKDEVEGEAESSDRGIIKVGVDVVVRIDIPDGKVMPDAIKCLEQALATYEANRAAKLAVESQSQNGDDDNNSNIGGSGNENEGGNGDGNDGGNGNKNGGGNGNGNPNRNDRGVMPVSCECTYHDFVKCQPLDFKGTKGVIGLTRWFEKIEMVFHINNCPKMYQVKYARNYNKVGYMARDCINVVVTTATRRAPVVNQRVPTCFECGRQGHYMNECPKFKNQTHINKTRKKTNKARGKAYMLGGGEANPDSNIVTGTFLLNNHYAFMLFGSGVDRSFVLSTFSALLYIIPSTLDVSYAVELADERVAKTNIVLRGYILGLLGHPFNIDLMPIELGSFDVLIVMDTSQSRQHDKSESDTYYLSD